MQIYLLSKIIDIIIDLFPFDVNSLILRPLTIKLSVFISCSLLNVYTIFFETFQNHIQLELYGAHRDGLYDLSIHTLAYDIRRIDQVHPVTCNIVYETSSEVANRSPSRAFELVQTGCCWDVHEAVGTYVTLAQPVDAPNLELKARPTL